MCNIRSSNDSCKYDFILVKYEISQVSEIRHIVKYLPKMFLKNFPPDKNLAGKKKNELVSRVINLNVKH